MLRCHYDVVGRATLAFVACDRVAMGEMPVVSRDGFSFDGLDRTIRFESRNGEHVAVDQTELLPISAQQDFVAYGYFDLLPSGYVKGRGLFCIELLVPFEDEMVRLDPLDLVGLVLGKAAWCPAVEGDHLTLLIVASHLPLLGSPTQRFKDRESTRLTKFAVCAQARTNVRCENTILPPCRGYAQHVSM